MVYALIALCGIVAGAISGVVGTGSSIILLPVLSLAFGPKAAIPIMGIAAIVGNASRVVVWRRQISLRAFACYSVTAVPAAVLGVRTLWIMPAEISNFCIGLFFFVLIGLRRGMRTRGLRLGPRQMAFTGGVVGYLAGVVYSTGPLTIPIFAGFGLAKGALLATEAAASIAVHLAKTFAFGAVGGLPLPVLCNGLVVGATLAVGTFLGKRFVLGMSEATFSLLIDAMLACAGLVMTGNALLG
ncbi:sulfite exporter TauE/SafE family protein [Desulfovibrio desulfuricans]|uniref:sulfite exporter TauE/SafE family protein n=1 Tax=Desulfovibrio desulfuricans TaxID=876 RepID=UPI0003B4C493|nr:sulfite exporter TauE/SafE family protein [Desulfovibrio desulfuricans]MDD3684446.1 sulfite exporter TauE/SafE family protein [Desulfovibrio desulfuricans]QTO40472.1 sulfite exporter TauE/SafE family protein [Desulfovibrio desulfuricans]